MAYPHLIRLRGPWDYEPLERSVAAGAPASDAPDEMPPPGRAQMPADWGAAPGADFRGCVRHRRRFNRPTGLEPHERVWLVLEGADGWAEVSLAGHRLGHVGGYALGAQFDVTALIEDRNELVVDVTRPHGDAAGEQPLRSGREHLPGGLVGQVRLEIRAGHWIEDLSLETAASESGVTLRARGRVAGIGDGESFTLLVDGPAGEVLSSDLSSNSTFDVSAAVEGLPNWPAAHDRAPEANIAVRLIGGAAAVWEKVFTLASRPIDWNEAERVLTVAAETVPLPVERFRLVEVSDVRRFAAGVEQLAGKAVACDTILPEPFYDVLDRLGVKLLQDIRPPWAAEVCPPRAHHASIVAWVAPAAALEPLRRIIPGCGRGGRPWIAREAALRA